LSPPEESLKRRRAVRRALAPRGPSFALLLLLIALAPPATAQVNTPGAPGKLTKAPKLIHFVEAARPPGVPPTATAEVILSIEVREDGNVGEVLVVKSPGPDWAAAAVAAARQFVFEPAEIDGVPASVVITYRYEFTIKEQVVSLGPQVNFDGVVLERFKKKPLADVRVAIPALHLATTTAADGTFSFVDVPIGDQVVELSGPTLLTVETTETIKKGERKTVKYLVELKTVGSGGVDEEVVVRAPRIRKETIETRIQTEEARRVPGTQGDTLKVVQNLPGVARSSLGSAALVVWGSAPEDTLVFVDGVEIPAIFHIGGLRSTINSDLVSSIDLVPGAYGAEYGNGLGGLVRVNTREIPDGVHGYVASDFIDSSAEVGTNIGDRVHFAAAGRISYLDKSLQLVASPNVGEFIPIPQYSDYQIMGTVALRHDEELKMMILGSHDHLQRTLYTSDVSETRTQTETAYFNRVYLRYTRLMQDGSSVAVTPWIGNEGDDNVYVYGPQPVHLDVSTLRYGLRATYRRKLVPEATLVLGLDFQGSNSQVNRVGSLTLPSREGDIVVFGQSPGPQINFDNYSFGVVSPAAYTFVELTFGPLTIVPGLRFAPTLLTGSQLLPPVGNTPPLGYSHFDVAVDPRINVAYRLTPRLTLNAAAGLYHQVPTPADFSSVFGNPTLGLESDVQLTGGLSYRLTGTLTFEAQAFYKWIWDLVSRNPSPTPPVADALVQNEVGRAYGGQFLLRQQITKGFFGWITYTLSESQRMDHPGYNWRLFDYDQTHVFSALGSYEFGSGWEVGLRFRYASGYPRTPVTGSFYDGKGNLYDPFFGAQNSIRIPPFYSLDALGSKTFALSASSRLMIFLDVQNITYANNPEEIVYNYNYTTQGYIYGLPILAILGARFDF
jgi:TonB family protein